MSTEDDTVQVRVQFIDGDDEWVRFPCKATSQDIERAILDTGPGSMITFTDSDGELWVIPRDTIQFIRVTPKKETR